MGTKRTGLITCHFKPGLSFFWLLIAQVKTLNDESSMHFFFFTKINFLLSSAFKIAWFFKFRWDCFLFQISLFFFKNLFQSFKYLSVVVCTSHIFRANHTKKIYIPNALFIRPETENFYKWQNNFFFLYKQVQLRVTCKKLVNLQIN